MRLDKFLSNNQFISRTECKKALKSGLIKVNGKYANDPSMKIDEEKDVVEYKGSVVKYNKYIYLMLNKPSGYVSSTDEPNKKTVIDLLPDCYKNIGLFPCGRLDIDTTGLLILTNDGQLSHILLSPKHHVGKTYYFECSPHLDDDMIKHLQDGVDIGEKAITKPAVIVPGPDMTSGTITITEGKFHQIKRMFECVGSRITMLRRMSFAGISLDSSLTEGDWRLLNDRETELLTSFDTNN